jgi:2'-5' RNA ligase
MRRRRSAAMTRPIPRIIEAAPSTSPPARWLFTFAKYQGRVHDGIVAGEPTIRAFAAITIPPAQRDALQDYLARCRDLAPHYRWVPADNLHVTIRYFGHLTLPALADVEAALSRVGTMPFDLGLGATGGFGSKQAPRVIWLGIREGRSEMERLARAVDESCAALGLEPADQPFTPI